MRKFLVGVGLLLLALFCGACQEPVAQVKPELKKFSDLVVKGIRIGIVDPDLGPAGRYALDVIKKLKISDAASAAAITENIITYEAHVRALLNKLLQREIDAGFLYRSDALAMAQRVEIIEIPTTYSVTPEYSLARIKGSTFPVAALNFIFWLRSAKLNNLWLKYGFKPLPAAAGSVAAVAGKTSLSTSKPVVKLTVFAAAVFYDVLNELAKIYRDQTGVEIVCEFAGSGKLYQKIERGAQGAYGADVFLSASPAYIDKLKHLGLADNSQIFMRNDLVVGVVKP